MLHCKVASLRHFIWETRFKAIGSFIFPSWCYGTGNSTSTAGNCMMSYDLVLIEYILFLT